LSIILELSFIYTQKARSLIEPYFFGSINVFCCLLALNPDIAVAIYCGLQTLAATLVVCFETPVFLTGSQR
jgi:hypothetical protein